MHDARGAIEFYKKAFGAKDLGTHATPDGKKIMHCGLALNGGVVFVCDDFAKTAGARRSPKHLGGSSVTIHLNCPNVQATWKAALAAGASIVTPLEKQFWGDTYGIAVDPFGQRWSMSGTDAGNKPDVHGEDYKSGAEKMYPSGQPKGAKKNKKKKKTAKR